MADLIAQQSGACARRSMQLIAEQRKPKKPATSARSRSTASSPAAIAINPFNSEKVPVWVANYILMDYGTGAIMSRAGARRARLRVRQEVWHGNSRGHFAASRGRAARSRGSQRTPVLPFTTAPTSLLINSGQFNGLACEEAIKKMAEYAEQHGFGKATVTYRLKDWGISRQRYWGTPIPMIYCEKDGIVPVPENRSAGASCRRTSTSRSTGGSPLGRVPEFVNATCPKCGGPARRETDTMDTFVDSSWYFYRYTDAHNDRAPFDRQDGAITGSPSTSTSAESSTPFCT